MEGHLYFPQEKIIEDIEQFLDDLGTSDSNVCKFAIEWDKTLTLNETLKIAGKSERSISAPVVVTRILWIRVAMRYQKEFMYSLG